MKKPIASKETIDLLMSILKDEKKVDMWLRTDNPLIGGVAPRYMVEVGREHKLIDFIKNCIKENKRSSDE